MSKRSDLASHLVHRAGATRSNRKRGRSLTHWIVATLYPPVVTKRPVEYRMACETVRRPWNATNAPVAAKTMEAATCPRCREKLGLELLAKP